MTRIEVAANFILPELRTTLSTMIGFLQLLEWVFRGLGARENYFMPESVESLIASNATCIIGMLETYDREALDMMFPFIRAIVDWSAELTVTHQKF